MIIKAIKSAGLSIVLAATFLVAAGNSSAFAQDWRGRDHDRSGWQDNRRERDHWQDNNRKRFEERRGHHGGLIRGKEDALEHRRFNEGFRGGYDHPHRRFADDNGHRYGRGY